jgi:hypothetical protein
VPAPARPLPPFNVLRQEEEMESSVAEGIRIEAPDALLGFLLLQRLPQVEAEVHPDGTAWSVEITPAERDPADLVDDLLETVRHWLRDEQIEETTVYVGGRALTVSRDSQ